MPRTLAEVGVTRDQFKVIAENVMHDRCIHANQLPGFSPGVQPSWISHLGRCMKTLVLFNRHSEAREAGRRICFYQRFRFFAPLRMTRRRVHQRNISLFRQNPGAMSMNMN